MVSSPPLAGGLLAGLVRPYYPHDPHACAAPCEATQRNRGTTLKRKIVIAGGTGFLGGVLAAYFSARGNEIVILTRKPESRVNAIHEVSWDGARLGDWVREFEAPRALINLDGISVNCRYHARNRKLMLGSRLNSPLVLGEAMARCTNPPRVWLNSRT